MDTTLRNQTFFSKVNIAKFLTEADDNNHLMAKVVLVVGIAGACRKSELTFLRVEDVTDEETYFRVNIPNTKSRVIREFVITPGDIEGLNFVNIIRKYRNLRPKNIKHNGFFVRHRNGKCGVQPVGINTIGQLPKMTAQMIGLPNCALFTGHCFRSSSDTLLADSGANILKIKQHGGWKSDSVAEGYVENKKTISGDILGEPSNINNIYHGILLQFQQIRFILELLSLTVPTALSIFIIK
ncbi:uncharacterized protein LOC108914474 [Anoplophora glabripennis]|uniref:uncharacterized protein LOC108914474 n=1 Tax=Anoplophora glabripennis TaxID=217634 RepID=UPI00087359AA|nr:uncharacterized protein LOC108914474 [Anoplophora glabripennis]